MSLRTVLMSLIVAGVLAGLVLISGSVGGLAGDGPELNAHQVGIDAVSIVEVRVESGELGLQIARRVEGTVDGWELQLSDDENDVWGGNTTRIRTVLRALGSASLGVSEDDEIGDLYGTLAVVDHEGLSTEIRFGADAAGGFVRAEVVSRGDDGIATSRWFGRIERSLRDSLLADGLESWRATGLFEFTQSQVFGAEVTAGETRVGLERTGDGWRVVEPWPVGADGAMVQSMLGLTLGLEAERFYDAAVYTDDLTGLESPMARISVSGRESGRESGAMIEIGAAVDSSGSEIFARYRVLGSNPVLVAIKTEGLNRLTPAPLAYVHQTAGELSRADVGMLRISGTDGTTRFECSARLDSWEADGAAVTPTQGAAIERLIGVLTTEKANNIFALESTSESPETLIGSIELIDRGGDAVVYQVALEGGDRGIQLHLSRDVGDGTTLVWVCGSAEAAGSGAWITALVAWD